MSGPREGDTVVQFKPPRSEKDRLHFDDWRGHLRTTRNGKELLGDAQNVRLALEHAPHLKELLRFNELSHRIEFMRAPPWRTLNRGVLWNDDDDVDLACWLQQQEVPIRSETTISRIVHAHACQHAYNPVSTWLDSLTWDQEPRITEVLIEVLSARGDGRYLAGVLRRFMISAVARAMHPGCKADHMLVLVGGQGSFKSSFTRVLGAPWCADSNSTFGTKDAIAELDGVWIMEIGELSGMKRSEIETVKHFVSRQVDRYRPAYGRAVIDQPRSCVFVGTTNEEKFLLDYTGNRRFWVVRCTDRINLKLLEQQRTALWAEAVAAYRAGEQWYLTREEEHLAATVQEEHRVVTELEQDVDAFLQRLLSDGWQSSKRTTVTDVYQAICAERDWQNLSARRQLETAIGQAIRKAGWEYIGRVGKERRSTYEFRQVKGDNPDNPF
jgi:putative DNA primase/helicase